MIHPHQARTCDPADGIVLEDTGAEKRKLGGIADLRQVRRYLERIGAEPRGMLTADVKEQDGKYQRILATVRFGRDGEVRAPEGYEPTDVEAALIAAEIKAASFPELVKLLRIIDPPKAIAEARREDVFELRGDDGRIVMVQVRIADDSPRRKHNLNFTYWSDQQWRCMEPDGPLPLYNQHRLKETFSVFLHEGAKAAAHAQWMVDGETREAREALARHPWGDQLKYAVHAGWISGANSAHRADWDALRRAGVNRVVVVTDRDKPGERAIRDISPALSGWECEVWWVRFDERWPEGFDLADPFPERLFKQVEGRRTYTGPALWECACPATWATRQVAAPKTGGRGRPRYELRDVFAKQWAVVTEESKPLFVNLHDWRRKYSEEGFNKVVRPFSDSKNADLLLQRPECAFGGLAYKPGAEEAILTVEGRRVVNTWVGPRLKPISGPYDDRPWQEYLEHLIPDESDRYLVSRWLATLIACPEVRMRYGLLLFSEMQGTGKGTLCEVLRAVLGPWNVSVPSEREVVGSDFNGYLAHKTLVFVNEIYAGSTWAAYRNLKEKITDTTIRVSEKYMPGYEIEAWAHFILCSNSVAGLTIEEHDRRFLVRRVTEDRRDQADWDSFYGWLGADGPSITKRWAEDFVEQHGAVRESNLPPETERKRKLIEESRSPAHRLLIDLAEAARERAEATGEFVALVDAEVEAWLRRQLPDLKQPLHAVCGILREGGMFETKRLTIGGRKRWCNVRHEGACDVGASEAKAHSVRPRELIEEEM